MVAGSLIFLDVTAKYTGVKHVVTDSLGLEPNTVPPDDMFPPVALYVRLRGEPV